MKLKRISSPENWSVKRKHGKWISNPVSGHKRNESLPLTYVLQDLGICASSREVKKLVSERKVFINARKIKSFKSGVGLFDVLTVKGFKEAWRMVYNKSRKLSLITCKDSDKLVLRVEGKHALQKNKGFQLNLSGGVNINTTKKTIINGDSLLVSIPDLKVLEHFKASKGSIVYIVAGSHKGTLAKVVSIKKFESSEPDVFNLKAKEGSFNTRKSSVFVIGNDKEAVQVS